MPNYATLANKVTNTLSLVSMPPYSTMAFALVGKNSTGPAAYINASGSLVTAGGVVPASQVIAADGAITITSGTVIITKASAAAITLAAPTATTDDFKKLTIESTTAAAHTVTNTSPGFNNGSTASDVATFGAAIGNSFELIAYQGVWYVLGTPKAVTLA